jgi:murein tripeptide amidase MpaA
MTVTNPLTDKYMNVVEVESALVALAAAHPTICELITLPHVTVEGRTTRAVRLGSQPAGNVDAYYLTGGVHAREWGSCEILVNLATDLCDAYAGGTGLGYGDKYFSAAEVRALIDQANVIVYPCVNPDGRDYSQSGPGRALWRKNRNPADSGGDPSRIGVDVNRNQDFLWKFEEAFEPGAIIEALASADPSLSTYHGSSPQSESETKNVDYLHNTFGRIHWYVDMHSFSEDILYVWGDDEMQSSDTGKSFRNHAYDHKRGLVGDDYGEYMPDGDLSQLIGLADAFTRSLAEVRGKYYVAKPGFSLYATSGSNDDYAYSRHITDPSKSKALSFTVEWGTEFQPPWAEMKEIIKDVCAGLIGLGLEALGIDDFIVTNRDTFSAAEVETTHEFDNAFYVTYDGFAPSTLGVPGASPAISFVDAGDGAAIGAITAVETAVELEDPGALSTPQRVTFTFRVEIADQSPFTAETREIYVRAMLAGITDVAPMRLLKQPNPYMLDGPISWLSTDVRVFQLRPGQRVNGASAVELEDPDVVADAPFDYVQGLLTELRANGNSPSPAFEGISQDEEASQLELSRTVGGERVLNFAVAKVRYRAQTEDALDVRVFFRTFNAMVSDLSYATSPSADMQNYRRTADGATPLLGVNTFFSGAGNQIVSIPYFAEPRIDSASQSMATQSDDWNKQTLVHAGATEAVQYFGCWLDFNQTEPQFPVKLLQSEGDGPFTNRVPIVQLVRGIHQCLAAEIRFQPGAVDPIPNGATPASSDRLSQRNLAIVESDNPGGESTHRVQHTLQLKPSAGARPGFHTAAAAGEEPRCDELVIRWGNVPRETRASLYFPDWNADEVLALAASLRPGPQSLSKLDSHTVGCAVEEISYVPLPTATQAAIPGLLTLELPQSVRTGERFEVDVQQHSGATFRVSQPRVKGRDGAAELNLSRRRVLGAFRFAVAVQAGRPLLEKLVRNLAVLRYIFEAIPASDSWHPVFARYIDQLGGQVAGLGVDPERVPPSAEDPGLPGEPWHGRPEHLTGRVREVVFDCFGQLEGFVLETCSGSRRIETTEAGFEELLLRACRDRLTLTVEVEDGVRKLVVRRC